CYGRCQTEARRRSAARQAVDARMRAWRPFLRPALAASAQPLEPRTLHWRLFEWVRRRRGCGLDARGAWYRYRWLRSHSRRAVRHCRPETNLWPGQPCVAGDGKLRLMLDMMGRYVPIDVDERDVSVVSDRTKRKRRGRRNRRNLRARRHSDQAAASASG